MKALGGEYTQNPNGMIEAILGFPLIFHKYQHVTLVFVFRRILTLRVV